MIIFYMYSNVKNLHWGPLSNFSMKFYACFFLCQIPWLILTRKQSKFFGLPMNGLLYAKRRFVFWVKLWAPENRVRDTYEKSENSKFSGYASLRHNCVIWTHLFSGLKQAFFFVEVRILDKPVMIIWSKWCIRRSAAFGRVMHFREMKRSGLLGIFYPGNSTKIGLGKIIGKSGIRTLDL